MRNVFHRWFHRIAAPEQRFVLVACALFLLAVMAFSLDEWSSRELYHFPWPSELHQLILFAEIFGHGLGVLVIIGVAAALDTRPTITVYRLAWCAYGAGLAANLGKLMVPRLRPHFASASGSIWTSFGLADMKELADVWDYSLHSFPSAHAATAIGLAMGLGYCYPRGRYLFLLIGALAGLQRIVVGAHFLSDVLAGSAVGLLVAGIALRRIEQRYGSLESEEPDIVSMPGPAPRRRSA